MILHRIVELQAHTVIRKITDDQEEYEFIEGLIESQKPRPLNTDHHYLIKTPFRYPLQGARVAPSIPPKADGASPSRSRCALGFDLIPQYASRFKPPFSLRNCLYGSECYRTSAYEYAYHWLLQRVHIPHLSQEPQPRTHFQITFLDDHCMDLRSHPEIEKLMSRKNYGPSHQFVEAHPEISSLLYPSCRDPQKGNCVVTFEINTLGKEPMAERMLHLMYQASQKKCLVQDPLLKGAELVIEWREVE